MELSKDFETQRRQVWIEAWTRTVQSSNCVSLYTPTKYADECLERFDERFKPINNINYKDLMNPKK